VDDNPKALRILTFALEWTGYKTREIKQLNPGIPILLFSGRTLLTAEELTYANAYVGNGATLDDLLTQVRVLIDPKTERRTAEVSDRKSESKHGESSGRHL
jgi:hypothetical protein